jgi:hypothetical protein
VPVRNPQVCPIKPAFLFSNVEVADTVTAPSSMSADVTAEVADADAEMSIDAGNGEGAPVKLTANVNVNGDGDGEGNGDDGDEEGDGDDSSGGRAGAKRPRVEKEWEDGKKRGQNKHRKKARLNDGVCSWVLRGEKCTFGDRCKFSHDLEK